MKKKIMLLVTLLLVVSSGLWFTSFRQAQQGLTIQKYTDHILEGYFSIPFKYMLKTPGVLDTTIAYTLEERGRKNKYCAKRQCDVSPATLYFSLYKPFDPTDPDCGSYYCFTYDKDMQGRFKALFGKDILKQKISSARKDSRKTELHYFNAEAIQAAFNRTYLKSTGTFRGVALQTIYNFTLKAYCRDAGEIIKRAFSQQELFNKLSSGYLEQVKKDTLFDGKAYSEKAAVQLLGEKAKRQYSCMEPRLSGTIIGMMLRRQCDGTLPVLMNCFKMLLKDYDPEYYAAFVKP
jgi:hypothetical protein